jgi:hypothetical protein
MSATLGEVDVDELELDVQLAQRPESADRTGGREPIELHGVASSFGPERTPKARGTCVAACPEKTIKLTGSAPAP